MTKNLTGFGLVAAGAVLAVTLTITGSGGAAAAQNVSGQDPAAGGWAGPGPGGPGRPDGPGRFGPGGRGGPGGRMGRGGPFGPLGLERLDLTDAQRDQVRSVLQSHDAEMQELQARNRAVHQGLQAVVMADTFDEGAIRARAADVAVVDAEMAVTRARVRAEVFQFLTPDQRTRANQGPPPHAGRSTPPAR